MFNLFGMFNLFACLTCSTCLTCLTYLTFLTSLALKLGAHIGRFPIYAREWAAEIVGNKRLVCVIRLNIYIGWVSTKSQNIGWLLLQSKHVFSENFHVICKVFFPIKTDQMWVVSGEWSHYYRWEVNSKTFFPLRANMTMQDSAIAQQ